MERRTSALGEVTPKLEMEMLYPVLYYDEQTAFGLLYGQMSDVLREHDLRFVFISMNG